MGDVVSIFKNKDVAYEKTVVEKPILNLLEDMVQFQEDRARKGTLDKADMQRGIILFGQIAKKASTPELRNLAGSYERHLRECLKEVK